MQVIETSSEDDATNIDLDIPIRATFNTTIDSATINDSSFIVRQDTTAVNGSFIYIDSSITFTPSNELSRNTIVNIIISSEMAGNELDESFRWKFRTNNDWYSYSVSKRRAIFFRIYLNAHKNIGSLFQIRI